MKVNLIATVTIDAERWSDIAKLVISEGYEQCLDGAKVVYCETPTEAELEKAKAKEQT